MLWQDGALVRYIQSFDEGPLLAEESRRFTPRKALRLLGKTLAAVGVVLFALVVGVACFVLFPPADLLRRGALPLVRGALNHQRLHVKYLALRPLEGLELRGIWLGAPAGYERPLLNVRRIVVRWDLSGLLDQRIRVRQLQVERPLVRVEKRKGKLSWVAFLDNMPKPEPKPPEEPSEPSKIQVMLDRVSIIGLGAAVDDGQRQIALDSLHVALHGLWSAAKSDLHLALELSPRTPGKHSLALAQRAAPAVEADLATSLSLDVRLQQVHAPRGSVELGLKVASRRLEAPWKLDPVKLGLALSATGDLPKEEARVRRMKLTFNGDELLHLRGVLTGLASSRDLDVLLTRLHLPLDKLAPYARALVKGVDFGGTLEVKGLRAAGALASLSKRLPRLSGVITAKKVWADVSTNPKKKPLKIKDLDLRLHLASAGPGVKTATSHRQLRALLPALDALPSPRDGEGEGDGGKGGQGQGQGQGSPAGAKLPVGLKGWITLGSFAGFGARVGGVDLRLAAGARLDGFNPREVAARIRLAVPRVAYRSRATGRITTSLRATLDASSNIQSGDVTLDRLALAAANHLVRLNASGHVRGWGKDELAATVRLAPVDLGRLWAWLPAKLRAPMPTLKLKGKLGLDLQATGRLPASGTSPLRAPVKVDARLALDGLAMSDRKLKLGLVGLSGAIEVKGRPTDLRLTTRRLRLAAFNKPDQQLSVLGISLPLTARITPRGLTAKISLKTNQVEMKKIRLATRGLHLDLGLRAALPVHRLILGRRARLGKTRLTLATGFDSFRMNAPANRIAVGEERTRLQVDYAPGRDTVLDFATTIASFSHAKQQIAARGISLTFKDRSAGLGALVLPKPKLRIWGLDARHSLTLGIKHLNYGALGVKVSDVALDQKGSGHNLRMHRDGKMDLDRVWAKVGLSVGSLSYRGLIKRPLRNNRVELDLSANKLTPIPGSFKLNRLSVSVPSRGIRLSAQGRAGRVLPFSPTNLPDFDVTLSAGVKNPRGGRGKATFLWPNIHGSGSVGVSARLRRTARDRVRLDGRLRASAFNLWTEKKGPSPSRLHLADIDANVPVAQEVVLLGGRGWALPRPKKLISDRGASVLYNTMRPYRKGRASFSMGGLTMEQHLGATKRVVKLDRIALDLAIRDNALLLSRMYIKLFGGDIVGAMQAQVRSLVPLDPILLARTQITGVRLSHLDPKATTHSKETEVSAMVDLSYESKKEKLAGRVNITRLSLKMLDSLLVAIDPGGTNISVQKNRKFLKAWYTKLADPRVKLVSIWISHGNLNMDIRLDAWFVVGTILKKIVKDMRIRRVNILPMLRQYVGPLLRKMERGMVKTTGRK